MFSIQMPRTFRLGDIADVMINGEPRRLHWASADKLTILGADDGSSDERRILIEMSDESDTDSLTTFWCSDATIA